MMSSMLRFLTIFALSVASVNAATNKEIENFFVRFIKKDPNVQFDKFTVIKKETVAGSNGWQKVEYKIDVKIGAEKMPNSQNGTIYTYENFITAELIITKPDSKTVSDSVLKAETNRVIKNNQSLVLKDTKIVKRFPLKNIAGWEAVQMELDLDVRQNGTTRAVTASELWFVGKGAIATDIIDINSGGSIKYSIKGEIKPSHYNKENLVAGNKSGNAKYKIIIFSDPTCPACRQTLPDFFKLANDYPKDVSLYYYHKAVNELSPVLMKAALLDKIKNGKKSEELLYTKELKITSPDEMEILKTYNKMMGTKFSMKEINDPKVLAHINNDAKAAGELLVNATPTIFINGKFLEDRRELANIKEELMKNE